MQVATALAVSWKPLTNSKPSAMKQRDAEQNEGEDRRRVDDGEIVGELGADVDEAANQHDAEDDSANFSGGRLLEFFIQQRAGRGNYGSSHVEIALKSR